MTNGEMTDRQDAQPRLREAEPGAGFSDDEIRHRAQTHAAAERRALDACHHGRGQRSMASNISAMTMASCSFLLAGQAQDWRASS